MFCKTIFTLLCAISTAFCQFLPTQGLYGGGATPYGIGSYGNLNPYGGYGFNSLYTQGLNGMTGYGIPAGYGSFPNPYGFNSFLPYQSAAPSTSGSQASAQSSSNGGNNVYGK